MPLPGLALRRQRDSEDGEPPLHILHVIPTLSLGGTERHLVDFIRLSDPGRLRHTVCVLWEPETLLPALEGKCDIVTLRLAGKHPWVHAAAQIYKVCRRYRPDVMHTWLYDAGISGRLGSLAFAGIPVVCGLQIAAYDPEVIRSQHWSPRRVGVLRLIDKATARMSRTFFVGISQFVLDSALIHARFPPSRMLGVIPNAISYQASHSEPTALRRRLNIAEDEFVILNVGRLDTQKGQEYLIRAFASAFGEEPKTRLVIFGDGPLRDHLSKLVDELGMTKRILLPGVQTDMGSVYSCADLFVFPSIHEGLGMALLEAMAAGLPCVASDIPPLREILENGSCGVLMPPGDVEAMAATLQRLCADESQRDKLAQLAANRAGDYTFEKTLPMWEQAYRRTCRTRSNGC